MEGATGYYNGQEIGINAKLIRKKAEETNQDLEEIFNNTFVHELIHAYTIKFLNTKSNWDTPEYKQLLSVWNEYRKNIVKENTTEIIRGISSSGIDAAVFTAINFMRTSKNDAKNIHILSMYNKEWKIGRAHV